MKVACVQCDVAFGDPMANASFAERKIAELKSQNVDLAIFPEAFLTGYCTETVDAARSIAISEIHPAIKRIEDAAIHHTMHVIFGFAGSDTEVLYNGAMFIEPNGERHVYRKSHLPELGYDKFVKPGCELLVFDTSIGKIGIIVCFDLRPPEPTRVLALKGAELVVLPTNWPEGADFAPDHLAAVRANENRVYLAACDRVGEENGFRFIGKSGIWDITGRRLATAGDEPATLIADLDLSLARNKRVRTIPDRYETTIFESRRPEIYEELTKRSR